MALNRLMTGFSRALLEDIPLESATVLGPLVSKVRANLSNKHQKEHKNQSAAAHVDKEFRSMQ
ncbi:MAG TPA: hypothetical protein VJ742_07145 [Nitrososphaera sp.]|nr:hypothetical protein [Nitrososphaera sp.]